MRRLTLMLVGTTLLGGSGLFALACSSDPAVIPDDSDDDDDQSSSGNGSSGNGTSGGSSSSGSGSGGTSGGSSGAVQCYAKLQPSEDKGPFCPFAPKSGSSGTGVACATGETCCSGQQIAGGSGFDPSGCVPQGDDCEAPTAVVWECTETNDCPGGSGGGTDAGDGGGNTGGKVCCLIPNPDDSSSTISTDSTNDFGCTIAKGEYGTRCKSACEGNDLQGCQSDGDCSGGKTCKLVSVGAGDRIYMGVCE